MVGFSFLADFGCRQSLISLDCSHGKALEELRAELANATDKAGSDAEGKVGPRDPHKPQQLTRSRLPSLPPCTRLNSRRPRKNAIGS